MQTKKSWKGLAVVLLGLGLYGVASAQQKPQAVGFPDGPGKETVLAKCFQCHGPGMWMDHRQDRRGWEGVLYRMVGRGALWSEEEVKAMAEYLAANYGKKSP